MLSLLPLVKTKQQHTLSARRGPSHPCKDNDGLLGLSDDKVRVNYTARPCLYLSSRLTCQRGRGNAKLIVNVK